jgi:CTP-dependent riboflavin kinase
MTPLEELAQLANEKGRRLFVAENPIDLSMNEGENCVYILELPSTAGAAGGRVSGIGERKMRKAYCFRQAAGRWMKVYETEFADKLERFNLPYHAAGLNVRLPDRTERVVSGVVDPELIGEYNQIM